MGGFAFIGNFNPNTRTVVVDAQVSTWFLVGSNGAAYASLAACQAASDSPWPGLEQSVILSAATIKCVAAGGGDGSNFFYLRNPSTPPDVLPQEPGFLVDGTNQGFTVSGPISELWIKLTANTDLIYITGGY